MTINARRLSRTALLIDNTTIMKYEPCVTGILRRIYRFTVGGSLPFQNEILYYQANPNAFSNIEIVEGAKVILIRYLEPTGIATPADVTQDMLFCLWTKIGALRGNTRFGFFKRTIFWLLNGPVPRSLRDLANSRAFSIGEKLRIAVRLLCLQLRQVIIYRGGRVIHNDLMLHNILRFGETFEPIDFEDALVEKKWIFADLTDLMFQGGTWSRERILNTLKQMSDGLEQPTTESFLQDHFKFGFLRYHIRATVMARLSGREKAEAAQRLKNWLDDA